jgi:PAS domain S-box-containing protein
MAKPQSRRDSGGLPPPNKDNPSPDKGHDPQPDFEHIFNVLPDAALVVDVFGDIRHANPTAAKLFLCDRQDFVDLPISNVVHGATANIVTSLFEILKTQDTQVIEAFCLLKNKTSIPCEIKVVRLSIAADYLVLFIRDTTTRRKMENMLSRLHTVVEVSPAAVVITSTDGVIEYTNPQATKVLGCDAKAQKERKIQDLLGPENSVATMLKIVCKDHTGWSGQLKTTHQSLHTYLVQASVSLCSNNDNTKPVCVMWLTRISHKS